MLGKSSDPKAVAAVKRAAKDLDTLLGDKDFVALNWPTIADCHCASAALSIEVRKGRETSRGCAVKEIG